MDRAKMGKRLSERDEAEILVQTDPAVYALSRLLEAERLRFEALLTERHDWICLNVYALRAEVTAMSERITEGFDRLAGQIAEATTAAQAEEAALRGQIADQAAIIAGLTADDALDQETIDALTASNEALTAQVTSIEENVVGRLSGLGEQVEAFGATARAEEGTPAPATTPAPVPDPTPEEPV